MNYSEAREATRLAMDDPQVGDRFSEMLSFWVYVIHRDGDLVTTIEGSPPVSFPQQGTVVTYTVKEMKERFGYGVIGGYWILLHDRGNNVEGWHEHVKERAIA